MVVRDSEVRSCIRLQEWILNQVKEVCGSHYSTVLESTKEECIRSPHYSASEISLKEVLSDVARSEDERVLVCPETKLPIRAEKLLLRRALLIPPPTATITKGKTLVFLGGTLDQFFLLQQQKEEVEVEVE